MTTNDTQTQLAEQVRRIAIDIGLGLDADWATELVAERGDDGEPVSVFDYLESVLDIEYVVNREGEYLGARILVAFGGPNIWINTRTHTVEGGWWGDSATASYSNDELGIDDALSEIWSCR